MRKVLKIHARSSFGEAQPRSLRDQSNCGPDLSSSATAPILRGAPLGGVSERGFFSLCHARLRQVYDLLDENLSIVVNAFDGHFHVVFTLGLLKHRFRQFVAFGVELIPLAVGLDAVAA